MGKQITVNMICWLLFSAWLLSGCGENLSEQEYIQLARSMQEKGDLHSAVIYLKNAAEKNNNNAETRLTLAHVYLKLGNGAAAEKELKRSQELGIDPMTVKVPLGRALLLQNEFKRILNELPVLSEGLSPKDKAEIYTLRGLAYLGEKKLSQAHEAFQAALDLEPDLIEALLGEAKLALLGSETERAHGLLEKAIRINSKSSEAWDLLGDTEQDQGKFREAEQAYSKAIEHGFDDAAYLLKRALVHIQLNEYESAQQDINSAKKLAARQPQPFLHYVQGLVYFGQQQYVEAQNNFEEALKGAPEYLPTLYYLGVSHYKQNHLHQAEKYLSEVLKTAPQVEAARRFLGDVRFRNRDFKGAQAILEPVLVKNPNDPQVLNLIGNIYLAQGKTQEGTRFLQKAVAQQPNSAQTHTDLGLSLLMQGEREKGIKELESAIEADPKFQRADLMLILTHLRAHEFDQALQAAERLHAKAPDNPDPLTLMAGAHLGKGDQAKAREALENALQVAPGDPNAAHNLASLEAAKGNLERAESLYQQVLQRHPGHLQTLLYYAEFKQKQGNIAEAKKLLEQAMERNPQALQPRVVLADYYLRNGQPRQALAITNELRESHPNDPVLLRLIAEAQLNTGDSAQAISTLEKWTNLDPRSAQAHYLLAKAYNASGQRAKVREALDKTLALEPNHAAAKFVKTSLLMNEGKQDEAAKLLQELKKSHPESLEVIDLEGELALSQKKIKEAMAIYESAGKRFPDSNRWPLRLAQSQWESDDPEAGNTTLENWLKGHPEDYQVRFVLANHYLLQNQLDKAKVNFAKLNEKFPKDALVLNNLAWITRAENPDQALSYAKEALNLAPQDPEIMDTLGVILMDKGQAQEGLRYLRKAVERSPNNLSTQFHLAQGLARNGDKVEAQGVIKTVLSTNRPFPERGQAQALLNELER